MFYFAALVAASAALTGCSSDDDLSAAQPAGVPFGVSASVASDQTRGVDLTDSNFDQFYLYGDDGNGTSWFTGDEFTPSGDDWTDGSTTTWRDGTWNFYAVTPSAPTSTTFNKTTSKFDYTVDPDHVDTQEDLMVAKATGLSSTAGKINLQFYHALANITVSVNLDALNYVDEEDPDEELNDPTGKLYTVWVKEIIFHNIKSSGTFDFSQSSGTYPGAWTGQSTYKNYKFTVAGDMEMDFVPKTDDNAYTSLTFTEGPIFLMPQEIDPWVPNVGSTFTSITSADSENKSYIEVVCQVRFQVDKTDGTDVTYYIYNDNGDSSYNALSEKVSAGFGSVYIPLNVSEFKFNKNYHLKLQLSTARNASGDIAISGGHAVIG